VATILGTPAGETLNGTAGNDTVIGKGGKDTALMGSGEDVFVWNPGDGSDVVEGGADTDTLRFTGSSASENFDISANGGRALFFRNVANVAMDLDDVERIEIRALSGADTVTVNDLSGTDVTEVAMDLAAAAGGKSADANSDGVVVNGSNGDDIIVAATVGSEILVTGLAAQVSIDHAGKTDMLILNALGGDDVIDATGLVPGQMALEVFGGLGDDVILGSEGDDKVIGGDGDDVALLGAGNDLFIWNPGDDNDVVEGQAGTDTLRFNGANVSENIDIFANGGRVVFFRNIANVVMDTNDVERIEFQALGGTDNIVVNDLSGTDVTQVAIDLAAVAGGTVADTSIDSVTVQGTNGDDTIKITSVGSKIMTSGLSAQVIVDHADKTDLLTVNGLGGNDTINASGLAAGKIALQINGGLGNDLLIGSAGNDTVNGGDGDDLALLGAGNDRFVWNPAMTTTRSRARPAPTRSNSTATAPPRTLTSPPTAGERCSSATSPTSSWT
jgi:Ca2+-binding RTX toxin-like protein